jgi:hypothetical protein
LNFFPLPQGQGSLRPTSRERQVLQGFNPEGLTFGGVDIKTSPPLCLDA